AIDLRYGVLFDLASRVKAGTPIDLSLMGQVNVIWQGDANAQALRSLLHCTTPTSPLNISGPETLSVRWLVQELAARLEGEPNLVGDEAPSAWLTNTAEAAKLFGYPSGPLSVMPDWVADWGARDGLSFNKPTKYEGRAGGFGGSVRRRSGKGGHRVRDASFDRSRMEPDGRRLGPFYHPWTRPWAAQRRRPPRSERGRASLRGAVRLHLHGARDARLPPARTGDRAGRP